MATTAQTLAWKKRNLRNAVMVQVFLDIIQKDQDAFQTLVEQKMVSLNYKSATDAPAEALLAMHEWAEKL